MLRQMSWTQFLEWEAYDALDPFGEERADYRSAQVSQALWNIARDVRRNPQGWPLEEFLLAFGDSPRRGAQQSLETQTLLIESWIAGHNAVQEAKQCPPTSA